MDSRGFGVKIVMMIFINQEANIHKSFFLILLTWRMLVSKLINNYNHLNQFEKEYNNTIFLIIYFKFKSIIKQTFLVYKR